MTSLLVQKSQQTASFFRLLADPTRYCILSLILSRPKGMCVYEIAEAADISHSAASHQLARLEDRGIVTSFRIGQSVCYELNRTCALARQIKRVITSIRS